MPRRAEPRSPRPRHARLVLLAAVVACAVLLAAPGASPRGEVLDLISGAGPGRVAVNGGEPSPPDAAPAAPSPTEAAAAVTPAPSPSPEPTTAPAPRKMGARVPPDTIAENPGPTAPPVEGLEDYGWPLAHPRVTLPFGPTPWGTRVVDGKLFHDGIDLATFCGDRVVAAHKGTVLAAGRHFDRYLGWIGDLEPYFRRLDRKHLWPSLPIVVVIDDGNGYRSVYAHFGRVVVTRGQVVRAGQLLGYEGATGHASGCHVHYGLFSPWERATFAIEPGVAKRNRLPELEIARVDPRLVLPPKPPAH